MIGRPTRAIVIGTSAGGVQALLHILPSLPAGYGLPLLVVIHLPSDRNNALVPLIRERCGIEVKEAEDKEFLRSGVVYFAPPDYHLLVETDGSLSLSSDELVNHSRPSIDVLFETSADAFGEGLTGIVLSGANDDGARGLRTVCALGGAAVVEAPETAHAAAMPSAALAACPTAKILSLDGIVAHLLSLAA